MRPLKRRDTALRRETARSLRLWELMDEGGDVPTVTQIVEETGVGRTTARKLHAAMKAAVAAGTGRPVPLLAPRKKKLRIETDGNSPF